MPREKIVILALDGGAFGRATLGLELGHALVNRGAEVTFVVTPITAGIIKSPLFRIEVFAEQLGSLTWLYLETCIKEERPRAVILCDLYSCSLYLRRRMVDPERLLTLGVPVLSLDLWDASELRQQVDSFGETVVMQKHGLVDAIDRLVPVPIARIGTRGGYCSLPTLVKVPPSRKRHIRSSVMRVDESCPTVLFCTGNWQHDVRHPHGMRLTHAVPRLIMAYLEQLSAEIQLIHVGPMPLSHVPAGKRYRWVSSAGQQEFDELLGSVDLLLSANISATTIGRAIAAEVPVLVVENSFTVSTRAEIESKCAFKVTEPVGTWLEEALPLYAFRMWPLGYWIYLDPLLHNNPYYKAVETVELIDADDFASKCGQLLFSAAYRDQAMNRQHDYARRVRALPSSLTILDSYLN